MKRKFLAVIPARSGSKRIPNKNIRLFNGRPLIYYSIKQALSSGFFDRVIVDTDSPKIAKIAKKYGAEVPFLRPAELASDGAKTADVLFYLIKRLNDEQKYFPDVVSVLQTTSPLREVADIEACYEAMSDPCVKSVCTISETSPWFFHLSRRKRLILVNKKNIQSTNTQDVKRGYLLNGCIVYMVRTDSFMKSRQIIDFIGGGTVGIITPKWRSVDLDRPEEWVMAEFIHKNKKGILKKINSFR